MTVAPWTVALDPPAAIEERTELNLNQGSLQVDQEGIDWGEAAIHAFMAEEQWGEVPVDFRVPNRVVKIPLFLGAAGDEAEEEAARMKLQQKVGQLQREGGVLLRQRAEAEPLYADIVNASLKLPDVWGETGHVEADIVLTLECKPDFFSTQEELDEVEEAGVITAVLQKDGSPAIIAGDYPARAIIALENPSAHDQRGLLWGVRCRNYSSDSTAALAISARHMSPINGASVETDANAYEGHRVAILNPPIDSWYSFLSTDLVSGGAQLTHIGTYRVWARGALAGGVPGARFRLAWSTDDATVPTYNEPAVVPQEDDYYLLDLGTIIIERPPVGKHWWRGFLQVWVSGAGTAVVDEMFFQPLDEYAGRLRAVQSPSASLAQIVKQPTLSENESGSHTAWESPAALGERSAQEKSAVTVSAGSRSRTLKASHLGFAIPSGAKIKGVSVVVGLKPEPFDQAFLKVSLTTSPDTQLNGAVLETLTFPASGSNSYLWGSTSITPTEANSTSFGVQIYVESFSSAPVRIALNSVIVTILYDFSESEVAEDAVLYASRKSQVRWDGSYREDPNSEAYTRVSQETGNLLRLPPSGLEERPVELFVKGTAGDLGNEPDSQIDTLSARMSYSPAWLFRP